MKFSSYCVLSLLGVAAVAAHAWLIHGVFFRAAVQVYTSKLSNLVRTSSLWAIDKMKRYQATERDQK